LEGSCRARTRSGHTRTPKHRRLRADSGPGWSRSVSNGRHITNRSTERLRHGNCEAPCGRSRLGSVRIAKPRVPEMGAPDCAARTVERRGWIACFECRSIRRSALRPTGFEAVKALPPRRSVRE
jgi:hypothetical protein